MAGDDPGEGASRHARGANHGFTGAWTVCRGTIYFLIMRIMVFQGLKEEQFENGAYYEQRRQKGLV
jgi:hypothetical protein